VRKGNIEATAKGGPQPVRGFSAAHRRRRPGAYPTPLDETPAKKKQYHSKMFFKPQHLHFVGIGGIGMSGIAEVLLNLGYQVSGSDLRLGPITQRLASLGARIHQGHDPSHLAGAKVVVVSSAVGEDNPEVQEARRRQVPVIPRGELLAELMRLKYGIAVAGSHGKTSTTSMIAAILSHAGLDPTVVVGGRVSAMGGANARVGSSDFLVVESDESDGSFLKLAPIIGVITNIDREHLDHYGSFELILDAFAGFANKIPFYGAAVLCLDDEHVQRLIPRVTRRTITYGASAQADLQVRQIHTGQFGSDFRLRFRGADLGAFHLTIPGRHNVLNAAAAAAVALELEVDPGRIRQALADFTGVERRFQLKGARAGITIVDDYGHHPTEIRATLETARQAGCRRVLVLFQPHRYTRTQLLMDDFARAFHQADAVFMLDIYAASEPPIEGVTAEALCERLRQFGHHSVTHAGSLEQGVQAILAEAKSGDLVLTLGAGSVSQASEMLLRALEERS
jgi:UDP-N-acetylmuramate--alanine ligase